MSTVQPPNESPAVGNHGVGLMVFGIFQILLGCLCGLMGMMVVAVTILGPMARPPQGEAMDAKMMIPGIVFYFLLAVALVWLGIGSIRARRWAWTLTVVLSWMWLIMGVVSFIAFVFLAGPMMAASVEQQGQAKLPAEALMMMRIVSGAIMFCIYVLLPAVFLIFYQRASVWAYCQQCDTRTRWTDRCPMPVLAISILMAFTVVTMLWMPLFGCVMPLCGYFVSGVVGTVVIVLIALVMVYLAWGTYRLQIAAWWGTLLLMIAGTVNMVVTFLRTDLGRCTRRWGCRQPSWT